MITDIKKLYLNEEELKIKNNELKFIKKLLNSVLLNSTKSVDPKDCSFQTIYLYEDENIEGLIEYLKAKYPQDRKFIETLNSLEKALKNNSVNSQVDSSIQIAKEQLRQMVIGPKSSIEDLINKIIESGYNLESIYIFITQDEKNIIPLPIKEGETDHYINTLIEYLKYCNELKNREDELSFEQNEIAQEFYGKEYLYQQMLEEILDGKSIQHNVQISCIETSEDENQSITNKPKWYKNVFFVSSCVVVGGTALSTLGYIIIRGLQCTINNAQFTSLLYAPTSSLIQTSAEVCADFVIIIGSMLATFVYNAVNGIESIINDVGSTFLKDVATFAAASFIIQAASVAVAIAIIASIMDSSDRQQLMRL